MSLAQKIKTDRSNQKRKQPFERSVFNTVGCIVKSHGLGNDFLNLPKPRGRRPHGEDLLSARPRAKQRLDPPPFLMLPEPQYRLTMAIIDRWDGPYLRFAHSPEEILLSLRLHDANPSLPPWDLLRNDFETLLRCESARRELAELELRLDSPQGPSPHDKTEKGSETIRLCLKDCRTRIEQLRAFISEAQSMESPAT